MSLYRLTINLVLLLACGTCFAETSQNILSEVDGDTGISIMNEEIRKLNEDVRLQNQDTLDSFSVLSNSGFGIVISGDLETGTNVIPGRYYLPCGGTITKIIAYMKTAPTGSSAKFDVNINSTSVLNSSKLEVTASSNIAILTTFSNADFALNSYLTVDIDQVGSSTAGADVVLSFFVEKAT